MQHHHSTDSTNLGVYRVKLGHAEVVVRAHGPEEALTLARRKLSADMPRFYDVIRALDAACFEIRPAA
ncbi:MAG: hypothetical protein AAF961_13990 [Planctomycetota bacterium]